MNTSIGDNIDLLLPFEFGGGDNLIDVKRLPNGNVENWYKYYYGTCIYIFEIDRKSRRIIGWRIEGSDRDCLLVP
jgi:hypothetical protein